VARAILSLATGLEADTLILAAPQHGRLWRAVKGNILKYVQRHLPERIELIVCTETGNARTKTAAT
jgi:hypothetical protein